MVHRVEVRLYGATVTIEDPEPPEITEEPTGAFLAGGWLRGAKDVALKATDETGIKEFRVTAAGVPATTLDARTCDYTRPAPCSNPGAATTSALPAIDTAAWPDGERQVSVAAYDAAGNATTHTYSVKTDNTAPAKPTDPGADSGPEWSNAISRQITWSVPTGQASPVTKSWVQLCPADGGPCSEPIAGTPSGAALNLEQPGEYLARVWLEDAAGNAAPANHALLVLRHDPDPPAAPTLGTPVQDGEDSAAFRIPVETTHDGRAPLTRLLAEICPADGLQPCQPLPEQSDLHEVSGAVPGFGSWFVRARVADAAKNVSPAAQSATLTLSEPPPQQADPTQDLPAAPDVTPEPTPAPTTSPPVTVRKRPAMKIRRVRRTRTRLKITVALPRNATGRLTVRFRGTTKRTRLANRTLTTVKLSTRKRAGRLRITYAGDATYLPRTVAKRIRTR